MDSDNIELIERHLEADINTEVKLYRFKDGRHAGRCAVRVRDLDAEENVSLVVYPSEGGAAGAYQQLVAAMAHTVRGAK